MFLYNTILQLPGCNFLYGYSINLTPEQLKEGFDTEPYLKVVTKIKFFRNGRMPTQGRAGCMVWNTKISIITLAIKKQKV